MPRGRPPIRTRQQIIHYLDRISTEKGLDKQDPPITGETFARLMYLPPDLRPRVKGFSELFHLERHWMGILIRRYVKDLQ